MRHAWVVEPFAYSYVDDDEIPDYEGRHDAPRYYATEELAEREAHRLQAANYRHHGYAINRGRELMYGYNYGHAIAKVTAPEGATIITTGPPPDTREVKPYIFSSDGFVIGVNPSPGDDDPTYPWVEADERVRADGTGLTHYAVRVHAWLRDDAVAAFRDEAKRMADAWVDDRDMLFATGAIYPNIPASDRYVDHISTASPRSRPFALIAHWKEYVNCECGAEYCSWYDTYYRHKTIATYDTVEEAQASRARRAAPSSGRWKDRRDRELTIVHYAREG